MLPLHPAASATAAAARAPAWLDPGGPLLTSVDVHPVFWGSTGEFLSANDHDLEDREDRGQDIPWRHALP